MILADRRPLAVILPELEAAQQRLLVTPVDHPRAADLLSFFVALAEEASEQDLFAFCRSLVRTQDDHDKDAPFKRFPDEEYIRHTFAWFDRLLSKPNNRVGFIWKSRQMMVSWTAIAVVLRECLFGEGRTIGWQSKKAEDANWMLRRIHGVWERLPDEVRKRHPIEVREGELRFPDRKNVVMAVPEGPEKPRQFTWSLFISDEMAFQAQARETYVAVQPAIRGGGAYIGISSAAPGFFQEMVEQGVKPGTHKELMKSWFTRGAMASWETNGNAEVLWIHHSADPAKDNAWADDFSKTLPGGRKGGAWRSEFDGEFDAHAGGRVFPDFAIQTHVIPPFDIPDEWPKWRSIDPGLEHALACGWYTLNPHDGMLIQYDEHVQAGWPEVARHCEVIHAKTGRQEIKFTIIDPAAEAKTLAGGGKSVSDLFRENGIMVVPAYRNLKTDQIACLADLIMVRQGEPRFKITSNCPVSIQQMLKYRWMQQLHDDKESPQKPVKIEDDAVDISLYMALNIDPKRMGEDYRRRNPEQERYPLRAPRRQKSELPRSLIPRNWEDEEP